MHDLDLAEVSRAAGLAGADRAHGGRDSGPDRRPRRGAERGRDSHGRLRRQRCGCATCASRSSFSRVPTVRLDLDVADISLDAAHPHLRGRPYLRRGQPAASAIWRSPTARRRASTPGWRPWRGPACRSGSASRRFASCRSSAAPAAIRSASGCSASSMSIDMRRWVSAASLENDRFVLRGVEENDGAEYLVVGTTLPPRVNVISHTRVISFSELVRRLSRVLALTDGASGRRTATMRPRPLTPRRSDASVPHKESDDAREARDCTASAPQRRFAACITVNIYFPAPEVRRAAEEIVEETWGDAAATQPTPGGAAGGDAVVVARRRWQPAAPSAGGRHQRVDRRDSRAQGLDARRAPPSSSPS